MKYESYAHAKTRLRYHLIFSTKYRRKCLDQIKDKVKNLMTQASVGKKFSIETQEIDKDHIHLLVKIDPSESITAVVRQLKQVSTYYIWRDFEAEQHLKKFYWSGKHFLWTGGYFASTIGEVSEKHLREYIEKQG
jgi:putative transposase